MKTRSFPRNKFKFSGSLPSSHFLSSLICSDKAMPTLCEGNSQASDLATRPCFPHLTTEPRPFNPQTRSLFTGKVAGGRLPHLRSQNRMAGKKREPPGRRTPSRPRRGARPTPKPGRRCPRRPAPIPHKSARQLAESLT